MATDCTALAYQGAALSDTVRVDGFLRPGFLVRRLIDLLLPTRNPFQCRSRLDLTVRVIQPTTAISHRRTALVKGPDAEQVNTI